MWGSSLPFVAILCFGVARSAEVKCIQSAKLDLQIIVDSSGSVGLDHFHTMMKKISKAVIGQFDIGTDKTRVALFKYSKTSVMRNEISLEQFNTKAELQAQVEKTEYEEGWTMTAKAMQKALGKFKEQERKDDKTAKVCLVFTDGEATDQDMVPKASKTWAKNGVTVFAIGIGSGISHEGLKDIAGADERAFEVNDFEAIGEIAKGLLQKVCEKVQPPQVIPVPKPIIPVGYKRGNDGLYYKFNKEGKNWNDAQAACKSEGGNLAIIFNEQTRNTVRDFMSDGWIGVSDQWNEGKWETPIRGNIPYSSWARGEPNNLGNEDCTMQLSNKLWNDVNCGSKQPYICQYRAVEPAATVSPPKPSGPKIPAGYKRGNDGLYYKFNKDSKNWNDAQAACKREGGNLAIIFNEKTRNTVRDFMSSGWIGVSDQWNEGKWETPVRGSIPYSSWAGGEPNNAGNEDCTMQHQDKKWNDLGCGSKQPYICQFRAVEPAPPLPPPPPPSPPKPKIPAGYKRGNDGLYYKFNKEGKNWNDAQAACKREGGNLAIIFNEQTRNTVRDFMSDGWIGVSDQWNEGEWETPIRGNIPYSSWARGEPNNQGNEDCTMQHSNKLWNDVDCGSKQPYICQYRAVEHGVPAAPPAPQIPTGYRRGTDGLYYKFFDSQKNWNDAQASCKSQGGNLAIIFNEQTRNTVRDFMADGWIGVSDQWNEGKWETPIRGNIPYSSWGRGEPNNLGNEDCTMQHSNKLWNDVNCGSKQPYICQYRAGTGKREEE